MPLFVACDGKGGTELKGMVFTQDVFEVDVGQTIKLTYKVFPTTAKYARPTFLSDVSNTMYTLDTTTGNFALMDPTCKQITLRMVYGLGENDYDVCTIIQKEYPVEIYFEKTNDIIHANNIYALRLMGKMQDGTTKAIGNNEYNIEFTSSAPNVIHVDNSSMTAFATGLSGSAKIEARIKKINGSYLGSGVTNINGISAQTTLNVVENVDYALVALQGENGFINTSASRTQTQQNTYTTTSDSVQLKVLLYSADNVCINNQVVNVNVISGGSLAEISNNADGTYTISLREEGTTCIQIISNATDTSGNPTSFVFYITKEKTGQ